MAIAIVIVLLLFQLLAFTSSDRPAVELHHHDGNEWQLLENYWSPFCKRELSTLRQIIAIFRYGDRTPETTFPNDLYQEESWPNGFGQLTPRGVERSFELGRWMRYCYDSFLHKHVSPKRVYARSSDYDRTLQSAQAILAGAYQPATNFQTGFQAWGETGAVKLGKLWQPFTVHTVPIKYDSLLVGHKYCPRFEELTREINYSKKTRQLLQHDRQFLEMVVRKSGLHMTDIVKVIDIVQGAVLSEVDNGRTPVHWLNNERDIERLAYYRDLIVALYFNNPEFVKIVSGELIKEILQMLMARANGESSLEHVLFSGHSVTLEGILASLGVLNSLGHREAPYGAAVLFELHELGDHSFAVAAYYRNTSTHDPIPLVIPGCASFIEESLSSESRLHGNSIEKQQKKKKRNNYKKDNKYEVGTKAEQHHRQPFNYNYYGRSADDRRYRQTLCKLNDLKHILAKKMTHNHQADCKPKHNYYSKRLAISKSHHVESVESDHHLMKKKQNKGATRYFHKNRAVKLPSSSESRELKKQEVVAKKKQSSEEQSKIENRPKKEYPQSRYLFVKANKKGNDDVIEKNANSKKYYYQDHDYNKKPTLDESRRRSHESAIMNHRHSKIAKPSSIESKQVMYIKKHFRIHPKDDQESTIVHHDEPEDVMKPKQQQLYYKKRERSPTASAVRESKDRSNEIKASKMPPPPPKRHVRVVIAKQSTEKSPLHESQEAATRERKVTHYKKVKIDATSKEKYKQREQNSHSDGMSKKDDKKKKKQEIGNSDLSSNKEEKWEPVLNKHRRQKSSQKYFYRQMMEPADRFANRIA